MIDSEVRKHERLRSLADGAIMAIWKEMERADYEWAGSCSVQDIHTLQLRRGEERIRFRVSVEEVAKEQP